MMRTASKNVAIVSFWSGLLALYLISEMILRSRKRPFLKKEFIVPFFLICLAYSLIDVYGITDPRDLNLQLVQQNSQANDFGNCSAFSIEQNPELKYCANTDFWVHVNSKLPDSAPERWIGTMYRFLDGLKKHINTVGSTFGKDYCNWLIGNMSCGFFYKLFF